MIKFLCNKFDEISEIFNSITKEVGYGSLAQQTKEFFGDLYGQHSSWHHPQLNIKSCGAWHYDGGRTYNMIISSYPNTTDIILPVTKKGRNYIKKSIADSCFGTEDTSKIESLLYNKDLRIFNPKPGDIFYLSKGVIHRTNPKAANEKHLVMRMWNVKLKELPLVKKSLKLK